MKFAWKIQKRSRGKICLKLQRQIMQFVYFFEYMQFKV